MSSAECCGDTNIRLSPKSHKRRSGRHPTEHSTLEDTLIGICPRDHLYMRIHNTVALRLIIQKSSWLLSTIMLAWDVHEREDEPKMADVLKKIGPATKASTIRPRRYKHDSIKSSIRKSQQGGGNKSRIYHLTVKEIANAYHAHATLKTLL